jgi:hypothetical protein
VGSLDFVAACLGDKGVCVSFLARYVAPVIGLDLVMVD